MATDIRCTMTNLFKIDNNPDRTTWNNNYLSTAEYHVPSSIYFTAGEGSASQFGRDIRIVLNRFDGSGSTVVAPLSMYYGALKRIGQLPDEVEAYNFTIYTNDAYNGTIYERSSDFRYNNRNSDYQVPFSSILFKFTDGTVDRDLASGLEAGKTFENIIYTTINKIEINYNVVVEGFASPRKSTINFTVPDIDDYPQSLIGLANWYRANDLGDFIEFNDWLYVHNENPTSIRCVNLEDSAETVIDVISDRVDPDTTDINITVTEVEPEDPFVLRRNRDGSILLNVTNDDGQLAGTLSIGKSGHASFSATNSFGIAAGGNSIGVFDGGLRLNRITFTTEELQRLKELANS